MINTVTLSPFNSKGLFLADRILEYLFDSKSDTVYTSDIRLNFYNVYGQLKDEDLRSTIEILIKDNLIKVDNIDGDNYFNRNSIVSLTEYGIRDARSHHYMRNVLELNDYHKILLGLVCSNNNNISIFDVNDDDTYEMNWRVAKNIFYEMANDRNLSKYIQLMNDDEYLFTRKPKGDIINFLEDGGLSKKKKETTSFQFPPNNNQEEINQKIDEIIATLKRQDAGQEVLFEEMQELKELYKFLNKKNWMQILTGKLVDLGMSKVIEEDTAKFVYEQLTSDKFKLLL